MPDAPPLADALHLVYIVDRDTSRDWERIEAALAGGVTSLWLRAPGASGYEVFSRARDLVRRCAERGAQLIVGDRGDVALAVEAHCVQLGMRSPPARFVRPWFRGHMGVSCHSAGELRRAHEAEADYAVLSPVFGVPHKGAPLGVEQLRRMVAAAALPVVALGGVEPENVASVRATGVVGVAVIRAIRDAEDPRAAAEALAETGVPTG